MCLKYIFMCLFSLSWSFMRLLGKLLKFVMLIPETVWIYFDPFISVVVQQWRAIEIQSILNNINSEKCIYKTTKIVVSESKSYIMDLYWRPSESNNTIFNYLFLFSIRSIFSEKISCRLQCVSVFFMLWTLNTFKRKRQCQFNLISFCSVQLSSTWFHLNWLQINKNEWLCFYVIAAEIYLCVGVFSSLLFSV